MALGSTLALALLLAPAALADDGEKKSLDDLLGGIPDIDNAKAEDAQDAEPEPEPDVPLDTYAAQVRGQVLDAWKPRKGVLKKNPGMVTRLVVAIDEQGNFVDLKPLELSGDSKYDERCVKAINEVGQVAPPPKNLRTVVGQGLEIVFSAKAWLQAH